MKKFVSLVVVALVGISMSISAQNGPANMLTAKES